MSLDSLPYITPKKLLGDQRLPIDCKVAIVCYTPMPLIFKQYEIPKSEYKYPTSDRYFIHTHNDHILFCQYKDIFFVVASEVYSGGISATTAEELHFYGIEKIIGLGFVGSFDKNFPIATKIYAEKALIERGTTLDYLEIGHTDLSFMKDGPYVYPINKISTNNIIDIKPATIWTHNSLYREYPRDVKRAIENECNVVNMDTAHLFAVCKLLNVSCSYYAVVTDVLVDGSKENEWENHLTSLVSNKKVKDDNKEKETLPPVFKSQNELINYILNNLL